MRLPHSLFRKPTKNGTSAWKQGLYTPLNPEKYIGDPTKITYRSSWEQEAFKVCDTNPNVLEWGSEILIIPYFVPNMRHPENTPREKRYIPDLYVVTQNAQGVISKKVIEIKPYKQTKRSRAKKASTKLYEDYTYEINQLKWEAARAWCDARGMEFIVTTERELFGNRVKR